MEKVVAGPLLAQINSPADLRSLNIEQLPQVCNELRQFIIDSVSLYGGHFAAGLGVIELTVALHYVLHTPDDILVWDVGHQAYGHKILTGRRKSFHKNREWEGLSGFPKRAESIYDAFGTGHSSTSISAVLGMAIANKIQGIDKHHVAVIGDGAITSGIAFEALNHAGGSDADILVILNDNNISIDPAVGAFQKYLASKNSVENRTTSETTKNHHPFFDTLNFSYFGPANGHDVIALVAELKQILKQKGPKVWHLKTIKGKGYEPAESNQTKWHATAAFDKLTGTLNKTSSKNNSEKYQDVFGKAILELAEKNPKIVGITPAMPSGSSLKFMMEAMPDRAFDVGIAEQHAVTLSAGMAAEGMKVFCTIYSTFLQRAYDMIIHDVALQNLPVIFCIDRAGLVGEDGATHHGAYDISFLHCIPNMIISAPMNEQELRNLMFTAQLDEIKQPFSIRYPRGRGVLTTVDKEFKKIEIGKGRLISKGEQVAILSFGHVGNFVQEAIDIINREDYYPSHYDMRFVKPLDKELLLQISQQYSKIITIEDGALTSGFGSAIIEFYNEQHINIPIKTLGIPDIFIDQGNTEEQMEVSGIDTFSIIQTIRDEW